MSGKAKDESYENCSHEIVEDRSAWAPIFLCPGFFGPAKEDEGAGLAARTSSWLHQYWGEATKLASEHSPVLCLWPGGLSSLHDRACEIFYQIKGGRVDYGEKHAQTFGHARFGRTYLGLYPTWSASSPIHIVGHSLGGTTVRMLQVILLAPPCGGIHCLARHFFTSA